MASPDQHQKIVTKRTDFLRAELLRRIREVPIAVPKLTGSQMEIEGGGTACDPCVSFGDVLD